MNTRWPRAVSSLHTHHHNARIRIALTARTRGGACHYSAPATSKADIDRHEKAALFQISGLKKADPVNPPGSTRPPPLKLPDREDKNVFEYYFRIGRAYGSFYWLGIKAVWFNYKAVKVLKERITRQAQEHGDKNEQPALLKYLSRSEFQLLERNNYDIGKLPFFGLLVCLFGEWLPLLVPFIPSTVPGTCRIPKQIQGMRAKSEERRRISFRRGISEPSREQIAEGVSDNLKTKDWPMVQQQYARLVLDKFREEQLYHLSCTLNNHNRLWDRVQLPPPSALLRRSLSRRLAYLACDDQLLNRDGGIHTLSSEEVTIACEERGMDVLGKREESLRKDLSWWLGQQKDDGGSGRAMFTMLFRRPNAWKTVVSDKR